MNETIETPDKANAVFVAGLRLNLSDQDAGLSGSRVRQLHAGRRVFELPAGHPDPGQGWPELRGQFGSVSAKPKEKDGQFQAFAIANPQNVAKVETAFKEELEQALKDGFTQKEIDADRDGWLQSRQVQRAEDRSLAQMLAARDYDGRTLAWDEDLEKKVAALKADDIVAAMRKDIDLAQVSIVKAGDFKKAAGTN